MFSLQQISIPWLLSRRKQHCCKAETRHLQERVELVLLIRRCFLRQKQPLLRACVLFKRVTTSLLLKSILWIPSLLILAESSSKSSKWEQMSVLRKQDPTGKAEHSRYNVPQETSSSRIPIFLVKEFAKFCTLRKQL